MDSFYYLLGIIAIAWLVVWTCMDRKENARWSPFDMKGDTTPIVSNKSKRHGRYGPRTVGPVSSPIQTRFAANQNRFAANQNRKA